MLGHDGPPTGLIERHLLTDERLDRCPIRTMQLASGERLGAEVNRYAETYYPAFKAGHRLTDGGIGDQPARYLELIGVFQEVESLVESKLIAITKASQSTE